MKNYASLRKKNSGTLLAVVLLAVCVLVSAAFLFSRLMEFSAMEKRNYISLTDSSWRTTVTVGQRDENGVVHYDTAPTAAVMEGGTPVLTASPIAPKLLNGKFDTYDENTVWSATTQVEIFRVSYLNDDGKVTVNSGTDEKVIAPGTENQYAFTLQNSGKVNLEYSMTMNAFFSNEEYAIPVVVRVLDSTGRYVLGNDGEQVDVLALCDVDEKGNLSPGYERTYILEWAWPFEGDDAYDTLLGNLAAEGEELSLTIEINTEASWSDVGGGEGPKTGDASNMVLPGVLMALSLAGFLFLLLVPYRREEADE